MTNNDVVRSIIDYIREYMAVNNISQTRLCALCDEKGVPVSQGTVSNILNKPSTVRLSTLLNICGGLELNLMSIMRSIYHGESPDGDSSGRMVYDSNDPAYNGYKEKFKVYFMDTSVKNPEKIIQGDLEIGDFSHSGRCEARLRLVTGDKRKDGSPFIKDYVGTLVISRHSCMYCNLTCDQYGDTWSITLIHEDLNNESLICAMGCAVTSSSGRPRYPTIHKVCLTRKELNEDELKYVRGHLRLYNSNIILSKQHLEAFCSTENIDPHFRQNLERIVAASEPYYMIPKEMLKGFVEEPTYAKMLSLLLQHSEMEVNIKITHSNDTDLFNILDLQDSE